MSSGIALARPDDPEFAILDGAAGYPAVVRRTGEAFQTLAQMRLVFAQPLLGLVRGQPAGPWCALLRWDTRACLTSP